MSLREAVGRVCQAKRDMYRDQIDEAISLLI